MKNLYKRTAATALAAVMLAASPTAVKLLSVPAAAEERNTEAITCEFLSADYAKLSWEAAEGATGYELSRSWEPFSKDADSFDPLFFVESEITRNECVITLPEPGTQYNLCVRPLCEGDDEKFGTEDEMYILFKSPDKGYKASNSVNAPSRVQYKLISHEKAALKWGAVSGADGYKLYIRRALDENGSLDTFEEVATLTKPQYSLKKLTPNTAYTYAVTAFRNSGDKVVESAPCTVSFITPLKWYYTMGNGSDTENIYRCHFDGSEPGKFNYFKLLPKESLSEGATEKSYKVNDVWHEGSYIYISLTNLDEFADDAGYSKKIYRVKSGGNRFEPVYNYERPDRRLIIDDDNIYTGVNSGISNGELPYITEAAVKKTVTDKNGIVRAVTLFNEQGCNISSFTYDSEYIYFFTTPYRVPSNDSYNYDYEPGTLAKLYRIKRSAPGKLRYDSYGYFKQPSTDGIAECLCGINYPYHENGIRVIGMKDGYLYYTVNEKTKSKSKNNYVLCRISPTGENDTPEKLTKLGISMICDAQISGEYLYIFTGVEGYRVKLGGKKYTLKKTFTVDDSDFFETEYALRENITPSVKIENGFIYITTADSRTYYRVKLSGKSLQKSEKPYLWR